jgi:endonuclease/exonuclease/phosphatase (EEP) superfamily protein YafD
VSLSEADAFWVRMADFPRPQLLIALAAVAALLLPVGWGRWRLTLPVLAGIAAAATYNVGKLLPYIDERLEVAACVVERTITVLVVNVRLGNRESGELLKIVRDSAPDVLLAMETDEWWDGELAALRPEMPHSVQHITGSYFGIHLLSRLPIVRGDVVFPVDLNTPAIDAVMALKDGTDIRMIAIHPRPPHPWQSSLARDAQMIWAGLRAREGDLPTLVAGDLNAVPWERTTARMRRIGRLIDPRERRGLVPTYNARSWWMAWPLDQILHNAGLNAMPVTRLPAFGSDHFPYSATFCLAPADVEPPRMAPGDMADARATLAAARSAGTRTTQE